MTNIRAFFILKDEEIILSRRFQTIEKKVQILSGKTYQSIPNDNKLGSLFKKV